MKSCLDARYIKLIERLLAIRNNTGCTQDELSLALHQPPGFVNAIENFSRPLEIVQLYDWLNALQYDVKQFFAEIDWFIDNQADNRSLPALPIPGAARDVFNGVAIPMAWQGQRREVIIEGMAAQEFTALERVITSIYQKLNSTRPSLKNREAIFQALKAAIYGFPHVNPSDLYHHVVYRLYLREYSQTQADRSWVRAGGEALELFVEDHYNRVLESYGIKLRWLVTEKLKAQALAQMGLTNLVGGSKLDIALYGLVGDKEVIFGGIHVKASLAERVSDDVPCSVAMINRGYCSYLLTLDAKSFPPPTGDLVNKGELGSLTSASDKRIYIETHGSFTGCYSYNLRTIPSGLRTQSGRKIYASTFESDSDALPNHIREAWKAFLQRLRVA